MFRNFALVLLTLVATALWASDAEARGRRCGGHGGCGGGGCGSGGCGGGYCGGGGCGGGGCGYDGCGAGGCGGGGYAAPGGHRRRAEAPMEAPAYIVVTLPANAQLRIDDQATSSTSATRTFVTPQLEPGYIYTYTFKADIIRDGKVETVTKKVSLTAGQALTVNLSVPAEAVAAK
jgi:uncharacterized protein (TIGR03000 family)